MEAGVEQAGDGPALGHVVELVERAEVAEESLGLVARLEPEDRVEQGLGVAVSASRWAIACPVPR